ncbi:MAG TPA: RluA family pseudouridine synthase [Acidimicrobiales bacterium]|nr:RluA family pseudouridine synthase [Acidimicrobiales bacterium]
MNEQSGSAATDGAPALVRVEVPGALDGERVDRGIAMLTSVSRAEAARFVASGAVVVGGKAVLSGSHRLQAGQLLEVLAPQAVARGSVPAEVDRGKPTARVSVFVQPEVPMARVVYVDDQVVVVDKPAGLVVHPGAGNRSGTLVDQLVAEFPDMQEAGPGPDRPGIVHRLDKGTSGLLVVARTAAARENLVEQMAARTAKRRYLAVVHGELAAHEGVIEAPVGRSPNFRTKMAVVQDGRFARTRYRALRRTASPALLSLVECRLDTGRTHQVRVHMAAIGHPVLGDDRYSPPTLLKEGRRVAPGLHRPFLHAAELGFRHPLSGEDLSFRSELPADLQTLLSYLGMAGNG